MEVTSTRADNVPRKVLIVDPDWSALRDTAEILARAGYVVTTAASFEEARQRLRIDEPHVLIADVRLGAHNGLHLVIRSRADFPKIAAIVTHVAPDPVLSAEATAVDAVYLVKPLESEELLRVLRRLFSQRPAESIGPVTATPSAPRRS
jgi:DNA-binding response OmpR family regulator